MYYAQYTFYIHQLGQNEVFHVLRIPQVIEGLQYTGSKASSIVWQGLEQTGIAQSSSAFTDCGSLLNLSEHQWYVVTYMPQGVVGKIKQDRKC